MVANPGSRRHIQRNPAEEILGATTVRITGHAILYPRAQADVERLAIPTCRGDAVWGGRAVADLSPATDLDPWMSVLMRCWRTGKGRGGGHAEGVGASWEISRK